MALCPSFVLEQLPGRRQGQFLFACAWEWFILNGVAMLALFVLTYVKELHSTWQHGVDSVAFYLVKVISSLRSMSDKWGNLVAARAGWMDAEEERRRNESWTSQRVAVRHFAFLNPLLWLFFFVRYRFDTINDRKEKRMGFISLCFVRHWWSKLGHCENVNRHRRNMKWDHQAVKHNFA